MAESYAPEDIQLARSEAVAAGFGDMVDKDLTALFLTPFPQRRFDEKSFPGLWPVHEPKLRKEPFNSIREFDDAVAGRAVELAFEHANRTIGIFSLTAEASEPMWAHYANDHGGVSIEFDPHHEFFRTGLREVTYSEQPISISSNSGWVRLGGITLRTQDLLEGRVEQLPEELFWRKRTAWSHEKEWRMVRPLDGASEVRDFGDALRPPIYLFEIPPLAVRSLTFGLRASEEIIGTALSYIQKIEHWQHLLVHRRRRTPHGVSEQSLYQPGNS